MATEKWWEDKFFELALYRNVKKELEILQDFEKGGISPFYNLFILTHKKPDPSERSNALPSKTFWHLEEGESYYSNLLVLEKIEKGNFHADPGEMLFVEVSIIINTSSRIFNCDSSFENRIRIRCSL